MGFRLHDRLTLASSQFEIHHFDTVSLEYTDQRAVYRAYRMLSRLPENSVVCASKDLIVGFAAGANNPYAACEEAWDSVFDSLRTWGESVPYRMAAAVNFSAHRGNTQALGAIGAHVLISSENLDGVWRDQFLRDWLGKQHEPQAHPRIYIERKWNLNRAKERKDQEKRGTL